MGLFLDAATEWNKLLNTEYLIVTGHKKKLHSFYLKFQSIDFYHLSGIHYATDVDFKARRKEYEGEKLINALLTGKINDENIEKAAKWDRIKSRLLGILNLKKILESDFRIYYFSANKLPFYSKIKATYLVYSEELQMGIFLFLDKRDDFVYCKSIFGDENLDYRANQTPITVLKKVRIDQDEETVLYIHPSYKEELVLTP